MIRVKCGQCKNWMTLNVAVIDTNIVCDQCGATLVLVEQTPTAESKEGGKQ